VQCLSPSIFIAVNRWGKSTRILKTLLRICKGIHVTANASSRRVSGNATDKDPAQYLPTSVQKSYFMLSRSARAVLDTALQKYRPGHPEPILVGGIAQLKPALRLMMSYRLVFREVEGAEVLTSYTRWLESVQLKEGKNQEVYVEFNPRFKRIWLESKKRLPEYMAQKPANTALRSQYALRLYGWAKEHVGAGTMSISLEDLRKMLGLEPVKDTDGNVIKNRPCRSGQTSVREPWMSPRSSTWAERARITSTRWSLWRGRRLRILSNAQAGRRLRWRWKSRRRSLPVWRRCTSRTWSIVTSNQATSW
jgi:hypothetical protein